MFNSKITKIVCFILNFSVCYEYGSIQQDPIDVVIPCHRKDQRTLDMVIDGIRKNGKNIRRVVVVSAEPLTEKAEWFDERLYPFNKADIALTLFRGNKQVADCYANSPGNKLGWIYQQLLKLYAPSVIPGISPNVLIIDADTIFINKVQFIDNKGNALYNYWDNLYMPYFEHAQRLLPGYLGEPYKNISGVIHHMLFQRPVMDTMFQLIKQIHDDEPWRAMVKCIAPKYFYESCMADYELYFTFALLMNPKAKLRFLKFQDMPLNKNRIREFKQKGYHYVSCHAYMGDA